MFVLTGVESKAKSLVQQLCARLNSMSDMIVAFACQSGIYNEARFGLMFHCASLLPQRGLCANYKLLEIKYALSHKFVFV